MTKEQGFEFIAHEYHNWICDCLWDKDVTKESLIRALAYISGVIEAVEHSEAEK